MKDQNVTKDHSIANMAGIQSAIANNESESLTELLSGESLDPLQKDYLIELAKLSNNQKLITIIEQTPVNSSES